MSSQIVQSTHHVFKLLYMIRSKTHLFETSKKVFRRQLGWYCVPGQAASPPRSTFGTSDQVNDRSGKRCSGAPSVSSRPA